MTDLLPRLSSFDMDGTLSDDSHRVDDALNGNWDAYFNPDRNLADTPFWKGVNMARDEARAGNSYVAYLTGRWDGALRPVTIAWLWKYRLPYGELRMRLPSEQGVSVPVFKRDHLLSQLDQYSSITHYDDDPDVVDLINATGEPRLRAVLIPWHTKPAALVGDHNVKVEGAVR